MNNEENNYRKKFESKQKREIMNYLFLVQFDFIPTEAWQGDIPASFCNGELLSYNRMTF